MAAEPYEPGATGAIGLAVVGARFLASRLPSPLPGAEGHVAEADALLRKELGQAHHDGAADGGAELHLEGVDRGDQRAAVERGRLGDLRAARESDEADLDALRQVAQEGLAASCAAARRVGLTSCTRMLSETSMASMIDVRAHGSVSLAIGRAAASSKAAQASQSSAGGTWRRHDVRPAASRTTARPL